MISAETRIGGSLSTPLSANVFFASGVTLCFKEKKYEHVVFFSDKTYIFVSFQVADNHPYQAVCCRFSEKRRCRSWNSSEGWERKGEGNEGRSREPGDMGLISL